MKVPPASSGEVIEPFPARAASSPSSAAISETCFESASKTVGAAVASPAGTGWETLTREWSSTLPFA